MIWHTEKKQTREDLPGLLEKAALAFIRDYGGVTANDARRLASEVRVSWSIVQLLRDAANLHVPVGAEHCDRWASALQRSHSATREYHLESAVWTYRVYGNRLVRGVYAKFGSDPLRHAAVRVIAADGKLFYLDDGWWGGPYYGSDHLFFSDEIWSLTVSEGW